MSLKDKFSDFLNEIEQMEKDNENLTEDLVLLEKEKADAYKNFDTDTHVLVEKESLKTLDGMLGDAYNSCDNLDDEARCVKGQAEEVAYSAGYARDEVRDAQDELRKLLPVEKVEDTE